MGRNKEITDDFTLRDQAAKAIAESRKGTNNSTTPNATPGNYRTEKTVTYPPLSV